MGKLSREESFGRLLAIANVLGWRVFDKHRPSISAKYSTRLGQKPAHTFKLIHEELMGYSHKFGDDELYLMDMFGEILADMDFEDFSNEDLDGIYRLHQSKEQNSLFRIMSAEEASERWGLSAGHIKNLAADGKIKARKVSKTWLIDKYQPNPSKKKNDKDNPAD